MDSSNTIGKLFGAIILIVILSIGINITERNNIPTYIEDGYEVYLDGDVVDADTIDFNQYIVSINREKECIYITRPSRNKTNIIPFFIPLP